MNRIRLTRKIVTAGVAIFAITAWIASWRIPTGAASGTTLHSTTPMSPKKSPTLRVATWNIHSGKGRDGITDIERIARQLSGFDFVGLNEVRGTSLFRQTDQAETLGRSLHAGWQFHPFERTWGRDDFGNAVVSTCPIIEWFRIPFPHSYTKGHGNLSIQTLDWNSTKIHVIVTHIDRENDRITQLQATRQLFNSVASPVILMGDLNSRPNDPELAGWLDAPGVVDVLAANGQMAPGNRIDWIVVRGLECVASGMVDHGESDHPLIWAELRLPGANSRNSIPDHEHDVDQIGTAEHSEIR